MTVPSIPTRKAKAARAGEILRRLTALYPQAHCELHYSNPLELLVATILSAQCTDKQVNLVTPRLFQKYREPADYARASLSELEKDLRSLGLFRNKARHIQACCAQLVRDHAGQVPASLEELVRLPGVGRKTANVVLGNAFQINAGIVVDTHVARLARRLGLTRQQNPEKIEANLQRLVPQTGWTFFSHLLIWHGRRCCSARAPACSECALQKLCPSSLTLSEN